MKTKNQVKKISHQHSAEHVLRMFLEYVPNINIGSAQAEQIVALGDKSLVIDWVFQIRNAKQDWKIMAVVKNTSHPSRLSVTMFELEALSHQKNTYAVLIVPWMSEKLESQCLVLGIGCLDLEGNGVLRVRS